MCDLVCDLIHMRLFNHICDDVKGERKCSALVLWNIQVDRCSSKWGRPIRLDELLYFLQEHNIPFLLLRENTEGKGNMKNGLQENLIKSSHNATGNGLCPVVSVTSGITACPQNPTVLLYSLIIS